MSPHEAQARACARSTVFTTHTPVPAGNDTFPFEMIEKYFWQQWIEFGMSREEFLALARQDLPWGARFSMTVLALRMSSRYNGVSQHPRRRVTRHVELRLARAAGRSGADYRHHQRRTYRQLGSAPEMAELYTIAIWARDWSDRLDDPHTWEPGRQPFPTSAVEDAPGAQAQADRLCARACADAAARARERPPARLPQPPRLLDPTPSPSALPAALPPTSAQPCSSATSSACAAWSTNQGRPVQFLFAGKAHPNDEPGKSLIRDINRMAHDAGAARAHRLC